MPLARVRGRLRRPHPLALHGHRVCALDGERSTGGTQRFLRTKARANGNRDDDDDDDAAAVEWMKQRADAFCIFVADDTQWQDYMHTMPVAPPQACTRDPNALTSRDQAARGPARQTWDGTNSNMDTHARLLSTNAPLIAAARKRRDAPYARSSFLRVHASLSARLHAVHDGARSCHVPDSEALASAPPLCH
eukprot:953185-Rhodomonas_salina.1